MLAESFIPMPAFIPATGPIAPLKLITVLMNLDRRLFMQQITLAKNPVLDGLVKKPQLPSGDHIAWHEQIKE